MLRQLSASARGNRRTTHLRALQAPASFQHLRQIATSLRADLAPCMAPPQVSLVVPNVLFALRRPEINHNESRLLPSLSSPLDRPLHGINPPTVTMPITAYHLRAMEALQLRARARPSRRSAAGLGAGIAQRRRGQGTAASRALKAPTPTATRRRRIRLRNL